MPQHRLLSTAEPNAAEPSATEPNATEPSATERGSADGSNPHRALIDRLQGEIRQLETAARSSHQQVITTGCPAIDRLLPVRGIPCGSLVEWFVPSSGTGGEVLSLLAARAACAMAVGAASSSSCSIANRGCCGELIVIDPQQLFYPLAAAAWGIDLSRTIVLREREPSQWLWAIDQCLRSSAVAAVWGWLEHSIDERWLRRFQLAAEQTGAVGLFIRPESFSRAPSWAEIQWRVQPLSWSSPSPSTAEAGCDSMAVTAPLGHRPVRLHLLRCRGGPSGRSIDLQIDRHTGEIGRLKHPATALGPPDQTAARSSDSGDSISGNSATSRYPHGHSTHTSATHKPPQRRSPRRSATSRPATA